MFQFILRKNFLDFHLSNNDYFHELSINWKTTIHSNKMIYNTIIIGIKQNNWTTSLLSEAFDIIICLLVMPVIIYLSVERIVWNHRIPRQVSGLGWLDIKVTYFFRSWAVGEGGFGNEGLETHVNSQEIYRDTPKLDIVVESH